MISLLYLQVPLFFPLVKQPLQQLPHGAPGPSQVPPAVVVDDVVVIGLLTGIGVGEGVVGGEGGGLVENRQNRFLLILTHSQLGAAIH